MGSTYSSLNQYPEKSADESAGMAVPIPVLRFPAAVAVSITAAGTHAVAAILGIGMVINTITSAAVANAYSLVSVIAAEGSNNRAGIVEFDLLSKRGNISAFHIVILLLK